MNHTVSLELAKRMKKLGWEKETLFCAYDTRKAHKAYNQVDGLFIPFEGIDKDDPEVEIHPRSYGEVLKPSEGYNQSEPLSLPILSEILEELPRETSIKKAYNNTYLARSYRNKEANHRYVENDEIAAEAVGLLWCKLKEEGII